MMVASGPVLGVLGGMGPLATATFLRRFVAAASREPDRLAIPVVVNSNPAIPDRTAFLLGAGPDPQPALVNSATALRRAGATCAVIPCNTANVFAQRIERDSRLPIVPWLDLAVATAARLGRSPIGVLATDGTLKSGVYQQRLSAARIPFLVPPPEVQRLVMSVIYGPNGIKARSRWTRTAAAGLARVSALMEGIGCGSLLLACTELPLAIGPEPQLSLPAIDPAQSAVEFVLNGIRSQ